MDRDQTGDEKDTVENKGGESAIGGGGGGGEESRLDRRASTQNQSSVSGANKPSHCPLGQKRRESLREREEMLVWVHNRTGTITEDYRNRP